jgi:hypothetical protein
MALNLLLANRAASQEQVEFAQVLSAVQHVSLTLTPISYALEPLRQVPIRTIEPNRLSTEMDDALLVLAFSTSYSFSSSLPLDSLGIEAAATLSLLEWLIEQLHAGLAQLPTLRGISTATFA